MVIFGTANYPTGHVTGISRRSFGVGCAAVAMTGCGRREQFAPTNSTSDSPTVAHARSFAEQHMPEEVRASLVEMASMVERGFTTAPVRVRIAGHLYEVPANYLSPKAKADLKAYAATGAKHFELPASTGVGGLSFFWPTLEGFSLTNWVDLWDRRRINYRTFKVENINSLPTEQVMERLHTAGVIEARPGISRSGLSGYRWVTPDGNFQDRVEWIGRTTEGRLFHMHSLIPGSAAAHQVPNPLCIVDMVDVGKREEVFYNFSLDLFDHWLEIERGTRRIIEGWRKD